jgi:hypothetical protein
VVCKQLFTAAEQARISAEFNATIDEYQPPPIALETPAEYQKRVGEVGVGTLHDGTARTMIGGPIEHRYNNHDGHSHGCLHISPR